MNASSNGTNLQEDFVEHGVIFQRKAGVFKKVLDSAVPITRTGEDRLGGFVPGMGDFRKKDGGFCKAAWGVFIKGTGVFIKRGVTFLHQFTKLVENRKFCSYCMYRILLICSLFAPCLVHAQVFHHLNEGDGYTQQCVFTFAQDSTGFIWLGGKSGLSRYDGVHFREYMSNSDDSNALCSQSVITLLMDRWHRLWVGTSRGLCRYDPERDQFMRFRRGPLGDPQISCLFEDREGNLWAGNSRGLFRMDSLHPEAFAAVVRVAGDSASLSDIQSVYEDSNGDFWASGPIGLVRLTPANGGYRFTVYRGPKDGLTRIWPNPRQSGNIWVGSISSGVLSFDPETGVMQNVLSAGGVNPGLPDNYVRSFCADNRGRLWIGTGDGLSIYDLASGRSTILRHQPGENGSLSQNSVFGLFKDTTGSMWVGTYYGGANVSYAHSTDFTLYHGDPNRSSISNDVVTCFAGDAGHNLWIGTDGGGLNYFDPGTRKFTAYTHTGTNPASIGANIVKSICLDRDNNLWVGTRGGGLNVERDNRFRRVLKDTVETEVESLLEDREGRFWVASEDRLRVYSRKGQQLYPYTGISNLGDFLDDASFYLLYEDRAGNIWMASPGKIFVLKQGETRISRLTSLSDRLFSSNVHCIREDHKGRMWFGTSKGGLVGWDPSTGKMVSYGEKQGLPDQNVLVIGEDDNGRLWLGTPVGLSCLDPDTPLIRNFTVSDGLPPRGFFYNSFFKDSNGELFFGGYNGFVSFVPANIDLNSNTTTPVFTSLDVFNKPVAIGGSDGLLRRSMVYEDHLSFGHDQDGFTIHFALLNFIKPEKNRYAYKMVGVDQDWNETATSSATYTGLPDGDYVFMVKGSNNDGVWSKPALLNVTIRPPFWRTWMAYGIYLLAVTALLFLVMRYLFLRERLKHEGALNQAKLNFFTNISHEIRTHLALIGGPVEKMFLRHRDEEDRRQLQYIKKNSESLLQLVRELMDFRKAESGNLSLRVSQNDVISFAKEIVQRFEPMAADRNIRLSLVCSANLISLPFDAEQLEKVLINLLINAFKFTPDGGTIDVLVEETRTTVEIRVVDNGKGIAAENLPKLFTNYYQETEYGVKNTGYGIGLALAKTIVELHKGQLKVESKPGVFTCFTVTLPKKGLSISAPAPEPREGLLEKPELSPVTEDTPDGKKYSVLIVEDNPELRSFLQSALDDQYDIIQAPDGLKGWESAIEELPDLIISDVMMPGMDGFSLCGKLKSDARTSHIPAILLTARSSMADQISGLEMGADIYLAKPFSIHILRLHLRNLLAGREALRRRYAKGIAEPSGETETPTIDDLFMKKALQFIEEKMDDEEFGVPMLSSHMLMSQPILYKKMKALTGMSVNDFIKSVRLKRAAQLLLEKRYTVYEVVYMVGYNDRKHFAKEFKKMFGVTPGEYGKDLK